MSFTLMGYGPGDGLEDISPFCLKVINVLRWTGTDYELEIADPRRTPRGKLPCLVYKDEVVPDSSGIIHYLENRHNIGLDDHLTAQQRASGRILQSVLEEHFYFILIYWRWTDNLGWGHYKAHIFRYLEDIGVPGLIHEAAAWSARRNMIQTIWSQGIGRMDREAVHGKGVELLQALSTLLDTRAFFIGDQPNSFDASAYAFLASVVRPRIPSPLQAAVQHFDNLLEYCERMRKI